MTEGMWNRASWRAAFYHAAGPETARTVAFANPVGARAVPSCSMHSVRRREIRGGYGADEFSNGWRDLSFALRLTCFRRRDNGASIGMMIVGGRSRPEAVTWHSCIKQERPRSIGAGNGRRLRLFR